MKNKNIITKFTDNVNMFLKASRMQNKQAKKRKLWLEDISLLKNLLQSFFIF